jgi:TolB-like protein
MSKGENSLKGSFVHRLFGMLALLGSSLVLVAAVAPTPTPPPLPAPKISPTPVASPANPAAAAASVLIYPFDVQTGVDSKIGAAIAEILAQEMAAAGGLTVMPVAVGVKRADFLEAARTQHADFYISGYVTPVGDSAAVVEQVVSVESGVILFSQTAQVQSVADVASQSLQARAQILAFVGRGTQNIAEQTAGTPAPTATNCAQMNIRGISGFVDSLFHHKGAPTPTPSPIVKPDRGIIVAPVTASGALPAADVTNATNELFFSLQRHYTVQLTTTTGDVTQTANAICGPNRNNTIATGTLAETVPHHGRAEVVFTLSVYTCFGALLDRAVGKADTFKHAVDAAVTTYSTAHPSNS